MASKEATVFVVDCGSTMGERGPGRSQTNLDWALEYVWDKITTTVATGRKTALVGVVGLRTDETQNVLEEEEDYGHISVFQELSQILMPELRKLRGHLKVNDNQIGDATSALVVAIQLISDTCKKLQYVRKIILLTDARAPMHMDDLSEISKKIDEDRIELVVLGVDFDDSDYGFKEVSKDAVKQENESVLKKLCDDCNGTFGTLAQAIGELGLPRTKATRPVHSYKGLLTLGNPEEYETALSIDVERYPKIMVARPPTASQFVLRSDTTQTSTTMSNGEAESVQDPDGLAAVKYARTYQIEDESAPGGKRDIERDDLAKGYEYGRTAVHISESDQSVTTYETVQGMDIIGFVDKNQASVSCDHQVLVTNRLQYERYMDMSRTNLIVAQRNNDKASMAFSSLIHALYELDSYAVVRFVPKEMKEPRVLLLAPNIEPDFECLYDVELPFAEDVRNYRFPPLDRVVTVSCKTLSVHRNLPNDELQDAISAYVDSMDLSTFDQDDEGQPTEYMPMDETYSPMLHRVNQIIKHRAVFPQTEPPPPYEILTRFSNPPPTLVGQSKPILDRVIQAADVKKVPPKARGKWSRKTAPTPLSDLDVAALLAREPGRKQKRIDPKNAIPEFKQTLSTSVEISQLHDACKQLKFIIFDWIRHSVGDSGYGRAVEGIRVMREEMMELEESGPFNEFLKELKKKVLSNELGGERKEMWYRVRVNRLGLIQKRECEASNITEEEAKEFMMPR